ncbi:MAG: DEAD/DEAH box helicase, partial [Deltaproteobacteria bacterium]|nr:DEAD/DEAH box helicase [Deltaproteobacteria bacterium]
MAKLTLEELLARLEKDKRFLANVRALKKIPPREGRFTPFPDWLHPRLSAVLERQGIGQLYSHQGQAVELVRAGRDVVLMTPTASGKTLCYNIPVLQLILEEPETRALYLFPTKALAQDQMH